MHRDAVEDANLAWLERFGLIALPEVEKRARRARFGWLAARAYPAASFDDLTTAAAWATWLFLRDDVCDRRGGGSAIEVHRRGAAQLAVLAGVSPASETDPFERALEDLRARMIARSGPGWMARFLADVQDYVDACAWEAANRERGRTPDLETYVEMRDLTGAVRTCFDVHELVEGELVPLEVRHAPSVRTLMTLANRMICWSNDIFSVEKEAAEGDCHNLVLVLERSGASYDQAIRIAARMHNDLVDEFERVEHEVPAKLRDEAAPFVSALKGWVRANIDWSIETGRYGRPTPSSCNPDTLP